MGTGGRLPSLDDAAAAGTQVQVVEPGSPEDTVSHQASPPAQTAPSAPAGAPADQGGERQEDVINPATLDPARPVLAPPPQPGVQPVATEPPVAPATPTQQAPAEGQPAQPAAPATQPAPAPASAEPAPAGVPPGATTPPAAPVPQATEPAAPVAPTQPTAEEIRQEALVESNTRIAAVQSGMDKRFNAMTEQQVALVQQLEQQKQTNRDLIINGVPDDQKALKLKEWELEDKIAENEQLRTETLSYGTDVELASLLIEYRDVPGIKEETLAAVPVDERDVWCMGKRNEHLQEQLTASQNGQPVATPAGQAPVAQPVPVPVPAGAQAPSDAGGAGTAPPPGQPTHNPAQNREAMVENMGSGWQNVTFKT